MKNILKRILLEELSNREVLLFKSLNKKKKELRTKENILKEIENLSKFLGLDPDEANYYYLLWKSNFRPEGDYENIKPNEFIDKTKLPQRTIPSNYKSYIYTKNKVPFKGSNLKGEWRKDGKGVPYYVVISYEWYPIYLFKYDKWFKVTDVFSRATGRQMSNANPRRWDDKIDTDVYLMTRDEMSELINGRSFEEITKNKIDRLISNKEHLISRRVKQKSSWYGGQNYTPFKVKFKVTDIRKEGDKAIIDVTIEDAGSREQTTDRWGLTIHSQRMIPSNGGYLRGEVPNVDKEKVETLVSNHIIHDFKNYVGKFPKWTGEKWDLSLEPEKQNFRFNFIHSKD